MLNISLDHKRQCPEKIRSSNPPVVIGIRHSNKSRARHHRSLKLGSKLKCLNINLDNINLDDDNIDDYDPETISHIKLMGLYNRFNKSVGLVYVRR